ncbi:MAG: uncharacterized protein K0R27_1748 [Xanthobacteraceae bacterium]|jgi:hypothetical protein|nr:uncharacterized protein [Xanthobacteraceae bacterium]
MTMLPTAHSGHAERDRQAMMHLVRGFQASQMLHVAATLRLADHLAVEARSIANLADVTSAHPASLYRLMRALATLGVLREEGDRRFSLTAAGHYLRWDVPGSVAPMAEMIGRPYFWSAWGNLLGAVRTGATSFDDVHGRDVWTYRVDHPEEGAIFDGAMAATREAVARSAHEAFDLGRFSHIVDVGGGNGAFVLHLLTVHQAARATLFDQPHVLARVPDAVGQFVRAGRCDLRSGDFFSEVPAGGDAYVLNWILHDWDDAAATGILRCCHRAMAPGSRLMLCEAVLGAPATDADGTLLDIMMMVMTGGRERTLAEFRTLLEAAGFSVLCVTPAIGCISVIECARADDIDGGPVAAVKSLRAASE